VAFRPPYGEFSARLIDVVHAHGMPAVLWDVVSGDPSKATTASGIIDVVKRETRGGSVIIFHINGRGWKTAEALPTVLHDLRARGFQLVSLSSLLGPMAGPPSTPPASSSLAPDTGTVAPVRPATARFTAPGPVPCEVPAPGERVVAGAGAEAAVGEEAWAP
jgi:hypothetical protein